MEIEKIKNKIRRLEAEIVALGKDPINADEQHCLNGARIALEQAEAWLAMAQRAQ